MRSRWTGLHIKYRSRDGKSACAALEMVEQELPVVPDMSMAHSAQLLLDACLAVGLVEWSIALALALENTLILSGTPHLTCASAALSKKSMSKSLILSKS